MTFHADRKNQNPETGTFQFIQNGALIYTSVRETDLTQEVAYRIHNRAGLPHAQEDNFIERKFWDKDDLVFTSTTPQLVPDSRRKKSYCYLPKAN